MSRFKFKESILDDYLDTIEKNPILVKNKKIIEKIDNLLNKMDEELFNKSDLLQQIIETNNSLIISDINDIPNYEDTIKEIKRNIFSIQQENNSLESIITSNNEKYGINLYPNKLLYINNKITALQSEKENLMDLYKKTDIIIDRELVTPTCNNNNVSSYLKHLKDRKTDKLKKINLIKELDNKINNKHQEIFKSVTEFEINTKEINLEIEKQIDYFRNHVNEVSNSCKDIKLRMLNEDIVNLEDSHKLKLDELGKEISIMETEKLEITKNNTNLFLNEVKVEQKIEENNVAEELLQIKNNMIDIDDQIINLNDELSNLSLENESFKKNQQLKLVMNNGYLIESIRNNTQKKTILEKQLESYVNYKSEIEINPNDERIDQLKIDIEKYNSQISDFKKRYNILKN